MVSAELGTKRTCPNCAARFYDLLRDPIMCPKCGTSFVAAAILPSKGDFPSVAPVAPKPRETEETDEVDTGDVELISLEDVEEDGKDDDDETAGIEDVDLGEDATDDAEEDDTFLVVEEDEGGNMSDLIEGGPSEKEEEN
jgi:uncharacterized protein (TIGR02300 family)